MFLSYSIFCSLLFAFTFLFSFPFSFYRSIYPLLSLLPIIINSLNSLSSHPSGNSEDFSLGETPLRSLILLYLWSYFYSIFSVEGIFIEQTPLSATSCLSSPKALRICGWFRQKRSIKGWVMPLNKFKHGEICARNGRRNTERRGIDINVGRKM